MSGGGAERVLLVSHFYPPHTGGVEVVVHEQARGLARRGRTVEVLTSACGAEEVAGAGVRVEQGVRVRRVWAWNPGESRGVPFPVFGPSLLWHAVGAVRRAEVVHVHDVLYLSSWVVALLCRLLRTPYVVHAHVATVYHPSRLVHLVQQVVRRSTGALVLGGARRVLAITDLVGADVSGLTPTPVEVLRNGVDTDRFRPAVDDAERRRARLELGLPADEVLVLFLGRFVAKKGFEPLVAARPEACRLVFAGGEVPADAPAEHLFLGRVDPDRVPLLYRAVDGFVSASVGEGPMTILEALASGLPVLVHEDPGARALGLPDDAVCWADLWSGSAQKTLDAFADRVRRGDGDGSRVAGARELTGGLSWERHLDRLEQVYGDAAGTRKQADRPTRVALVAPHYAPRIGGVESYVARIATMLRDSPAHDVVVLTAGSTRRTVLELVDGVPVVRLGTWLTVSNTPLSPLWPVQVRRALRRWEIDVVNAHSPVPGLADVATLVAGRRPVVLTYHAGSLVKGAGGPVGRAVDAVLRGYERFLLPRVFARADRLVAVSPVATSHATGRAALLPPGVDTARFRPAGAEPTARVTYVGRIDASSRWKGLDVLLEAFALVADRVPGAVLELVGDGDDLPRLRGRAAELGVADRVLAQGSCAGEDLVAAYQRATVVVLPSLTEAESFGMVLVEAMACGRPVVASAVGGIPYVVRDGVDGVLVPPGDAAALAEALTAVLTDPEHAETLGRAGREQALARWDWEHRREPALELLSR